MNEQRRQSVVFVSIERECTATKGESGQEVLSEDSFQEAQKNSAGQRKNKPTEQTGSEAKLHYQGFHDSIVGLAKKVRESIAAKYPSVKIIEFRTSLHSSEVGLNLLVVLDAVDIDTELQIGLMLPDIEKDFSDERKIACEIRSVRKIKYVDGTKITEQFPFIVKA
jgi:hypothetical protein